MTRNRRLQTSVLTALLALGLLGVVTPNAASALGLGAYFEYLRSDGEVDLFGLRDSNFESDKFGFGFALDTNLARNRLFNYRLNFGYQHTEREFDAFSFGGLVLNPGDVDADGFSFTNTFGIALWKGRAHRLWLGPSVRLGVDVFDTGINDLEIVDFSAGGGAELGLNLHTGEHMSIGITAAYHYLNITEIVDIDTPGFDDTEDFDGHEHVGSVNLTIFFRTGADQFK